MLFYISKLLQLFILPLLKSPFLSDSTHTHFSASFLSFIPNLNGYCWSQDSIEICTLCLISLFFTILLSVLPLITPFPFCQPYFGYVFRKCFPFKKISKSPFVVIWLNMNSLFSSTFILLCAQLFYLHCVFPSWHALYIIRIRTELPYVLVESYNASLHIYEIRILSPWSDGNSSGLLQ